MATEVEEMITLKVNREGELETVPDKADDREEIFIFNKFERRGAVDN